MNEEELNALRALANGEDHAPPDSDEEEGKDTPSEESQTKPEVEEDAADEEGKEPKEEEIPRVPYSRFETVNERAIRAEQELETLKQQVAEAQTKKQESTPFTGELPDYWVELYGDSELSRKAWNAEQKRIEHIRSEAADTAVDKAIEKIQKIQKEEQSREKEIVDEMENAFTDYSAKNKRTFNDSEQSAILDIMDDLTPKDEAGKYIVSPLQYLSKAVQWHDMQSAQAGSSKKESRKKATSVVDASSEGEPSGKAGDVHFRPGDWDSWRHNPMLN